MESRAVFERNLAAIRKRFPRLAQDLETASSGEIAYEIGPRGTRILKQDGVLLGSAYDPVREGEQIATSMAAQPADMMVAIGFGLGFQFAPYLEKNPATLIIYEPSIARLKAALEGFSIVNLLAMHRDLYLTTDLDVFNSLFSARYVSSLRARLFPHPAILRLDRNSVSEAVDLTLRIKSSVDSQIVTSVANLMPWAWITAQNGERISRSPNLGQLEGAFAGKPAVVVAAGPSLDKQLPLLREVQDRVVVIAIGQTLKSLRAAGIEPDLVHVVESKDVSHQLTNAGDTTDLCTAFTPDCHPRIFDVPTRARFCAIASASPMGRWIASATRENPDGFTMGGGTVAQGAVGIAALLGCNPISLIGQDLAFTEGRLYASNSAYDFVSVEVASDGECHFTNWDRKHALLEEKSSRSVEARSTAREMVWVESWYGGEKVPTWVGYAGFIEQYRDMARVLAAAGIRLVNCTEGGARIPAVEHIPFREFLDATAVAAFDARSVLYETYDQFQPYGLPDYTAALQDSRRLLVKLEVENRKGLAFVKKVDKRLSAAKSDQQRVEILRGLARYEKRVRQVLDQLPWLDALVQPEIYHSLAGFRRTERQHPTNQELAEESAFLFNAARNGIGRARQWLDAFEDSFRQAGQAATERSGRTLETSGKSPKRAANRASRVALATPAS